MKLCINADDFGLHGNVNAGIREAIADHLVSSVSVMTGHAASAEICEIADDGKTSVGLHFSLTSGKNSLFSRAVHPVAVCLAWCSGKLSVACVRMELDAQLARLRQLWPGPISHVDCHEHIHAFYPFRAAVRRCALEHQIPYVRIPHESSPRISIKSLILNAAFPGSHADIAFFGINLMGPSFCESNVIRQLEFLAARGVSKALWMVHVGHDAPPGECPDRDYPHRERELAALMNMGPTIERHATIVPLAELL